MLRLLLLKHVRNWSYDVLEREVRANLAYRDFARLGLSKVPDAKTLARIGQILNGEVIAELHRRLVKLAQEKGAVRGKKMRVDTTVVESSIHYPTDSGLLGDGARVLTRTMKRIERKAGKLQRKVRNRIRSVNRRVRGIALSVRLKGVEGERRRKRQYRELLRLSRQILNDTRRVLAEVEEINSRTKRPLQSLTATLAARAKQVRQVIRQTKAMIFQGIAQWPDKLVSLFEPHTEIIRKGKAQAWRTGCEGRISVLKRRHGLGRCRYRGLEGMKRWVGFGVMADNLINIGKALAARA